MAQVFPTLENIQRLKVKPTDGELFLVNYLCKNLPADIEIYFQPFLNGDMPDIILMQKDIGVSIIEVKDWNLDLYKIDIYNQWHLKQNNATLKSPFQQVFQYKDNMFNLHINGLLQQKLKNKQFYGRIQPFVYFHKATKQNIELFYANTLNYYREQEQELHIGFKNRNINHKEYENKLDILKKKKSQIQRDLNYCSVGNDSVNKICLPQKDILHLFTESIYKEFHRYLQPPYHTLNQGIDIKYNSGQEKLITSKPIHQKISGVAGSGKTVVLAKRAVNAYKRHNSRILILTYNITLRSYIHDKISDVREDFGWKNFYITNYHQLITQLFNNLNINIEIPKEILKHEISDYLDKHYYSNGELFENHLNEIVKYKSIFIDEIQDYKSEWIKIIRKYFLDDEGEMVLLGDPKQNIYHREMKNRMPVLVQGFGEWQHLKKSVRHEGNGNRILNLAKSFQSHFLKEKYDIDTFDNVNTPSLNLGIYKYTNYINSQFENIANIIFKEIKDNNIHPNDVCILSSNVNTLRELDFIIRNKFNERTLTTFETKEMFDTTPLEIENIRKIKKIGFNLNNGLLKISTIHSFKGYEISTLFLIIDDNDNEEVVYTGITRSKFDIMIFSKDNSLYTDFFKKELEHE